MFHRLASCHTLARRWSAAPRGAIARSLSSSVVGTVRPPQAADESSALGAHRKVVVIGGGVVGCSVLYHLAKLGWTDVALLERKVLTAGSTWHAAGGFHALNSDPTVSALQSYTIELYEEIERVSGQSCGVRHTGGVSIATTPERMEYLRNEWARHRVLGIDTQVRLLATEDSRCLVLLMPRDLLLYLLAAHPLY